MAGCHGRRAKQGAPRGDEAPSYTSTLRASLAGCGDVTSSRAGVSITLDPLTRPSAPDLAGTFSFGYNGPCSLRLSA